MARADTEGPSTPPPAGDSDLSSPPTSIAKKLDKRPLGEIFLEDEPATTSTATNKSQPPEEWIQPYICGQYDYYNPTTGEEEDDIEVDDPQLSKKIKYQAITAPEVYQKFLENAKDMSYDELYQKLALVNDSMVQLENEFQQCSKALAERDMEMLHRKDEAVETAKLQQEAKVRREDLQRDRLGRKFESELMLPNRAWRKFLKKQKSRDLDFLEQLRNKKFMEEREKAREAERLKEKIVLADPFLEKKKSTIPDLDKKLRLGPTFVDGFVFDDMVMADAYGFPYSKHPTHVGRQPIPLKTTANGRTRPRNTATASHNDAPSNLPTKRVRKARVFADGLETTRSATPVSAMPLSGHSTAKSKAPSKLQDVAFPESEPPLALPESPERAARKSQPKKRDLDSFQSDNLLQSTEVDDPVEDGTTIAVEKPAAKAGKRRKVSPENLDPNEEALEKERKREQKRAKQSAHMAKRWANGDMEKAKETRKATLAKKKAEKQAAKTGASSTDMFIAPPKTSAPILPPIKPAPQPKLAASSEIPPKIAASKDIVSKNPTKIVPKAGGTSKIHSKAIPKVENEVDEPEPVRTKTSRTRAKNVASASADSAEVRHSSRARKPTTPFGGGDGAMDFDDDFGLDENEEDDSGDADVEMSEGDETDE